MFIYCESVSNRDLCRQHLSFGLGTSRVLAMESESINDLEGIEEVLLSNRREKTFSCTKCEKTFTQLSHVRRHENTVHSNKRPFNCSQCEKKFKDASGLKSHEKIHTGEKPFNCTYCDKRFGQPSHLKEPDMGQNFEKF